MKCILVLTPIYPAPDIPKTDTPVVHYFTREWLKMGYDVRVVHYVANFPKLFYMIAKPFKEVIGARVGFGIRTIPYDDCEYMLDGVQVKRISIRKIRPHAPHPKKDVDLAINKTISYCKTSEFVPDIIVGHWANPQLEILSALKKIYGCKTCYVSHGDSILPVYKEKSLDLLREIDIIGFRCEKVKNSFFSQFPMKTPYFMCFSGIPASFLDAVKPKDFSELKNFIYVGTLIKRKYPSIIPSALSKAYGNDDFCMRFIGSGAESKRIENVVLRTGIHDKVKLLGRVGREKVRELVDDSQVFIMISRNEAYGLVYLEAMARGCITIASRDEGFDGIIKHGENGFLCQAGNEQELVELIKTIRLMPKSELQIISNNARKTAESLTDIKAARYYLESLKSVF